MTQGPDGGQHNILDAYNVQSEPKPIIEKQQEEGKEVKRKLDNDLCIVFRSVILVNFLCNF